MVIVYCVVSDVLDSNQIRIFSGASALGVLRSYNIIVRGVDLRSNYSKVLSNVTIDAISSTLLLANLTEGVTYTVSIAAATFAGMGPFSNPATLRLDPITKQLDQTSHRYPINHANVDDVLTQPWFIAILGTILAILMLSFGAMVFVKRKHMIMKQTTLAALRGKKNRHSKLAIIRISFCKLELELKLAFPVYRPETCSTSYRCRCQNA